MKIIKENKDTEHILHEAEVYKNKPKPTEQILKEAGVKIPKQKRYFGGISIGFGKKSKSSITFIPKKTKRGLF